MRYQKLNGVILKKQNLREADQIVTLWTRELGKVRVLCKSMRLAKSKLSYAMQDMSLVEINVSGRHLSVLISARCVKNYKFLREDLKKTAAAFYASEMLLKMTADEHPNPNTYKLLVDFLEYLNDFKGHNPQLVLESFALKLMSSLGFSYEFFQKQPNTPKEVGKVLTVLQEVEFSKIQNFQIKPLVYSEAHKTVKNFIELILERDLKSEPFLIRTQ